eukprot:4679239-Pyramimonas_sp.AAC.1
MGHGNLKQRKLGDVDHVYMEFAMATDSLLLGRQGVLAPAVAFLRGEYPTTKLVPVQPTRPQGWLAESNLLAQWSCL